MSNVIPFRPRKKPDPGAPRFDETAHPRSGDGKFAPKTSSESGVRLSVVNAGRTNDERVGDAVEAMSSHPEGLSEREREDYDYFVPRAINPGLSESESQDYVELMRGDDPQTAHRMSGTVSDLRIKDAVPFQAGMMREHIAQSLDYLAAEHPDSDPRKDAAVAAICHHLDEPTRRERWARFEEKSREANSYRGEPVVSLSGQQARQSRDEELDELLDDHPLWKRS